MAAHIMSRKEDYILIMRRLWRKGMLAALAALQTTGIPMTEDVNYDGETEWNYEYSEGQQHFRVPATGIYRFTLYGAQGASTAEHIGGKGGSTSVELELTKNEQVDFFIGSIGNVSNGENTHENACAEGGGATTLSMEEVTLAVAGGGGGATGYADGGQGGIRQEINDGIADESGVVYTAGGGRGDQDGADGYLRYHVHTGGIDGGGCYTQEFHHTHDEECYADCGAFGEFRVSVENPEWVEARCGHCGQWSYKTGSLDSDFVTEGTWRHRNLICRKDTDKVEFYRLGCGKTTTTIEESVPSMGGSGYYDETRCRNPKMAAGVQEGNGRLDICMTELDGATLSYYQYDMTPLGDITVARGDCARYPITYAILREKNNNVRYEFIGWDDLDTEERETLKNEETVQEPVTQDRRYQAVYKETPIAEHHNSDTPAAQDDKTVQQQPAKQQESTFSKTDVIHEKEPATAAEIALTPQSSETEITYETKTETTTAPALTAHATWQSDSTHSKTESALTAQTMEPSEPQTTKEDRVLAQPLRGREDEPASEETLLLNSVASSEELEELDRTERALAIGIMSLGMMLVFLLLFLLYRYRGDFYEVDADHYNK